MVSAKFSAGSFLGLYLCAIVFAACFLMVPPAFGGIENPSFEFVDPNGGPYFPTAIGWSHENYAADVNDLTPLIEAQDVTFGNFSNWLLDPAILLPKDGERLLMLSTGNLNPASEIEYARAWQEITVQDGDRLSGYYFFGTCDYNEGSIEYDDFITISMVGHTDPNIVIKHKHVSDIGDHSSMAGWERFEYRFDADTAGTYDLSFMVRDVKDAKVNSYLGIDDLQLCDVPEYGDINYDCQADNHDFAIISANWGVDCEGPELSDPNYCPTWTNDLGSPGDVDGDDKVDITDIKLLADGWLSGN